MTPACAPIRCRCSALIRRFTIAASRRVTVGPDNTPIATLRVTRRRQRRSQRATPGRELIGFDSDFRHAPSISHRRRCRHFVVAGGGKRQVDHQRAMIRDRQQRLRVLRRPRGQRAAEHADRHLHRPNDRRLERG